MDIVLSKIRQRKEDIGSLTSNQKIKLNSLNNEYNLINASANAVKQIEFQKFNFRNLKSQEEVLKIREEILQNLKKRLLKQG